jgi:hypothetical protein
MPSTKSQCVIPVLNRCSISLQVQMGLNPCPVTTWHACVALVFPPHTARCRPPLPLSLAPLLCLATPPPYAVGPDVTSTPSTGVVPQLCTHSLARSRPSSRALMDATHSTFSFSSSTGGGGAGMQRTSLVMAAAAQARSGGGQARHMLGKGAVCRCFRLAKLPRGYPR